VGCLSQVILFVFVKSVVFTGESFTDILAVLLMLCSGCFFFPDSDSYRGSYFQ